VPCFLDSVAEADVLFPNASEAALLAGRPPSADPAESAATLSAGRTVVVTLGREGALAAVDGRITARVPAVPARAVDSTGAGDAFAGGLLAARLTGADLPTALAAGCTTGAAAVSLIGARPPTAGSPGP